MKNVISVIFFSLMMLVSSTGFCDVSHDNSDVGEVIYPIAVGAPSPFSGVLLSPKAIAKITVELRSFDEKQKIAVNEAIAIEQATCVAKTEQITIKKDADLAEKQVRLNALLDKNANLVEQLEDEKSSAAMIPYYIGGSFLGGILATALVVYATK